MEAKSVIRFETVVKLNFFLNSVSKTKNEHKKYNTASERLGKQYPR